MTDDDLLVRALQPGWGNASYSFGPAGKTTATFNLYLGSLKSYDSQLYNPYLDVFGDPLEKKCALEKIVTLRSKSRSGRGDVLNSSELQDHSALARP